jgi:hypothetical protein
MARHSRIWLAIVLAVTCAVGTPAARAGLVTPDSMGPPVVSSSGNGDVVAQGGLVFNQYRGLGVLFSPEPQIADDGYYTTVVHVNNLDVFAGTYTNISDLTSHVSYQSPAGVWAGFYLPGRWTPDMADTVTASFDSIGPVLVQLEAFDKDGNILKSTTAQINGVLTPVELDVAGIQSVYATAFQPVIDPIPGAPPLQGYPYAWGVASIEWHEAPEPAGFVLGGLGMLALLAYAWRRRSLRLGVRGA